MKILHVITDLRTGGAEKLMVDLLPRLRDKGNEVDLCVLVGRKTPFSEQLENAGIRIIPLSGDCNFYNPILIPRLRKLMKNYDVVHTHNTTPQFFAAIGKPKSVKLITTEHSTSNRRRKYKFFHNIDRLMYKAYDRIICIAKPSEDSLRSYLGSNYPIAVISNGVNIQRFLEAKGIDLGLGDCKKITMVAGYRYEKDHATLIRSLHYLPSDYHVVLVGDGLTQADHDNMVQFIDNEKLTDRVHRLGVRGDVPNILKSSDVVVMSSHREGLSLSNVEGMCSGHPFVASDVEGLREVTQGYGVLFPHGDAKALAEIIQELCTNKQYAAEVAAKCMERAKMYDIQKMVDNYNDVYLELLRTRN